MSVSLLRWSATVAGSAGAASCHEGAALRVLEVLPSVGLHILTVAGIPVGPLWFRSVGGAIRYAEAEYCAASPVAAITTAPLVRH